MRILAIDYGDKRLGLAIGSTETGLGTPLEAIKSGGWDRDVIRLSRIIKEQGAEAIVIGLPLNMDGTEGRRAEITRKFGALLQVATTLQVHYHDERLTSKEAHSLLAQSGLSRQRRELLVDSVSAQLILESWVRYENNQSNRESP
ncbi:MAG: Holliday junction resolvase RuvX [Firmicutes bacterium]|nr:Holliday junction resolvase RuvX [Bacillota bacterium]